MIITSPRRRAAAAAHCLAAAQRVDAPGGVDVNKTIGYVIGVCPVNKTTKAEIMSGCQSNPHFEAWH